LKSSPESLSLRSLGGFAPLHYAARLGRAEVSELLLSANADVNAVNYEYHPRICCCAPPACYSETFDRFPVPLDDAPPCSTLPVKDTLKYQKFLYPPTPTSTQETNRIIPIFACDFQMCPFVIVIIFYFFCFASLNTSLHWTSQNGNIELSALLLSANADVNATSNHR
jgi:ankyrin repeat protein